MTTIRKQLPGWELIIFTGEQPIDVSNDSLDVEVVFSDGRRYGATFCTLANIASLMQKYRETGECGEGLYYWCADLVIARDLAPSTIQTCVEDLMHSGELSQAFLRLADDPPKEGE